MLVKTDDQLYKDLETALLYQAALPDSGVDYTPDTSPRVVRWGSSEYVTLVDNGNVPFIAVQLMGDDWDHEERPPMGFGLRLWDHTSAPNKTEVAQNKRPVPVVINYQLDIRSPKDLWLRQIETEIARANIPWREHTFAEPVLGATAPLVDIPIRFRYDRVDRRSTIETKQERRLRSVFSVTVNSWLLPSSDSLVLKKTYKTAEVDILAPVEDPVSLLEQWTFP